MKPKYNILEVQGKKGTTYRLRVQYLKVKLDKSFKTKSEAIAYFKSWTQDMDSKFNSGLLLANNTNKITLGMYYYGNNKGINMDSASLGEREDSKLYQIIGYRDSKKARWEASTRDFNDRLFENHFSTVRNIPICKLDKPVMRKWLDTLHAYEKEKNFTSNIPCKACNLMKQILINASHDRLLEHTVINYIKDEFKKVTAVSDKCQNNYIDPINFDRLCNEIINLPEQTNLQIMNNEQSLFILKFLYYTGLRAEEARAIKRKDFHIGITGTSDGNKNYYYIKVDKQMDIVNGYYTIKKYSKTKQNREVRLEKTVFEYFMSYMDKYNLQENDYVLGFRDKSKPITRQRLSDNIKRIINDVNNAIENRNIINNTHTLLFNSNMSPQGFRISNTRYLKDIVKMTPEKAALNQGHTLEVMQKSYVRISENDDDSLLYEVEKEKVKDK